MRVLVIGDIVGGPGRTLVHQLLPTIREEHGIDLVIANGENSAGGAGITPVIARELLEGGIDVITSGNHIFDKREIVPFIGHEQRLLRPLNYPPGTPGQGWVVVESPGGIRVAVVNLAGQVFMDTLDCPFRSMESLLPTLEKQVSVIIVDFHGEATSEKQAFGWFMDGRVSAVFGTHTHVATADERVLPKGTAYISDIGMTGPVDSILGVDVEVILKKFLTHMPQRFTVAKGPAELNGIILDIDEAMGFCTEIVRITEAG